MADRPSIGVRQKTVTELDRETYEREFAKVRRSPNVELQLSFFNELAKSTPADYTNLFEFFDAIPKFVLTPQTSFTRGEPLELKKFTFRWGETNVHVVISPVVLDSKDPKTNAQCRKEVLPGPREETIYRVLKKMVADTAITRRPRERSVVIQFSLHMLRRRLGEVGHEFKIAEIKEALEVLARSPIKVKIENSKKDLFAGTYISLKYTSDESDETGERSLAEVGFNELAAAAVTAELYDRIHYQRLMSLSPLAAWIYELLTRNFRQAGADCGFKISLSRIMRESGLPARSDLRANLRNVRKAIDELVKKSVLAFYPAAKEDVQLSRRAGRGRRAIEDVVWTVFPSKEVVQDIRADNAAQASRRVRNGQHRLPIATAAG